MDMYQFMAEFYYEVNTCDQLKLRFSCDVCGTENLIRGINVPSKECIHCHHNYTCKKCGKIFNLDLLYGEIKGKGIIKELPNNQHIDCYNVHYEHWTDFDSGVFFFIDGKEIIESAIEEIETLSNDVKQYMYRLLYINALSLLEGYVKNRIRSADNNYFNKKYFRVSKNGVYLAKAINNICGSKIEGDPVLNSAYAKRTKIVHENAVIPYGDSEIVTKEDLLLLLSHVDTFAEIANKALTKWEMNKLIDNL